MMPNRMSAAWLRPVAGFFALVAVLGLSACGGGSGSPASLAPAAPPPMELVPDNATVFSGVPTSLSVTGGVAPYRAFSANSAVLPVTQSVAGGVIPLFAAPVAGDTSVVITVQDSKNTTLTTAVTVKPATLLNNLTITPNASD